MISKKLIPFLLPLTFVVSHCALGETVDAEDIIHVGTDKVTLLTNQNNIKPQRVAVMFNVYQADDDNDPSTPDVKFHCPVRVRTVDNVCEDLSLDPSVVCRRPGGSTGASATMKKIKWRARGPSYTVGTTDVLPTFTVTFDNNLEPCKPDVGVGNPGAYWSGSRVPKQEQTCRMKNAAYFHVSEGKFAYVKFNIVGIAPSSLCDPLDPFFIVRN